MKNRYTIALIIITVIFLMIGTTLAYWSWEAPSEDQTRVTFTFDAAFTCSADAGGDITNNDVSLAPSTCDNSAYAIQREVKLSTTQATNTTIGLNMWLKINDISSGLSQTANFRYALTDSEDGCTNEMINDGNTNHVIASGTFQGTNNTTNSEIPLFTNKFYNQTTTNDTYYLYIWLDKEETSQTTQNQTFNITIGGECELFKDLVCEAGEYLPAGSETCTECPAGSFCPGWAGSYDGTEHGRTSCSTLGNGYTESYAGAAYQTECYMPKATLTGKYVATAGSASTNCTSGGYCPGTLDVFYGNTGGRTAYTTLGSDYTGSAASSDEDTDCYIPAASLAGKYVATANANAISCTAGYYCNSNTNISYGSTGGRTGVCATGSYSAAGASSCTACTNGKTTNGTGQTSCNANCSNTSGVYSWATASWSNGTVSNSCTVSTCNANYKKGSNACSACDAGTTTGANNTSASCSACTSTGVNAWAGAGQGCAVSKCNANYYKNGSSCSACDAGKYTSAGNTSTSCTSCSSTGVNAWAGAGQGCAVSKCNANYYKNGSSCTACASGKYTSAGNTATSCSTCSGTGVNSWAAAGQGCVAASCSTNYKRSGNGCAACGGGYYSSNGNTSTSCSTCSNNNGHVSSWSGNNGCTISSCASGYTNSNNSCIVSSCTVYCTSTSSCSKTKPSSGLYGVFTCTGGQTGSISQCWYGSTQCNGGVGYPNTFMCTFSAGGQFSVQSTCNLSFSNSNTSAYSLGLSDSGYSCSC